MIKWLIRTVGIFGNPDESILLFVPGDDWLLPPVLRLDGSAVLADVDDPSQDEALLGVNSMHFRILTKIFTKKFTKIFTKKLSKFILKNSRE